MADVREVDPLRPIWPVRPGDRGNAKQQPAANRQKEAPKEDANQGDNDDDQPHVDTFA